MDVILLQRVEKLGQMGEVVKVKPGYARNYLLPGKKAIRATKENLARFETERAQLEAQNLKRREEAERVAERVAGLAVVMIRQAGESGQLYGSVSGRDIADAATGSGLSITRPQVLLDTPNAGFAAATLPRCPASGNLVTSSPGSRSIRSSRRGRRRRTRRGCGCRRTWTASSGRSPRRCRTPARSASASRPASRPARTCCATTTWRTT